jgi:hypothetical protein
MDARMLHQPGAGLQAGMTTESIADDEEVAFEIVGFDVGKPRDGALGIARGGASGQLLAIPYA